MRPRSIVYFDWAYLAMIALSLLNMALSWKLMRATWEEVGQGRLFALAIVLISYGIYLALWFFVSRRASNVAKWILVVFCAIAVLSYVYQLAQGLVPADLSGLLGALSMLAMLAAVWMLFRPDARDWFAGRGPVDPGIFS